MQIFPIKLHHLASYSLLRYLDLSLCEGIIYGLVNLSWPEPAFLHSNFLRAISTYLRKERSLVEEDIGIGISC